MARMHQPRWAMWAGATAAVVAIAATASTWLLEGSAPARPLSELLAGPRERRFTIRNSHAFRARPRLIRVPQFRSLYSASLPNDPQEAKQPAPSHSHLGLFHGYMPPLRGEYGGSPEYKYSENMLACPCAGVAGMCLSAFVDEEFDQGPQACECRCDENGRSEDGEGARREEDDGGGDEGAAHFGHKWQDNGGGSGGSGADDEGHWWHDNQGASAASITVEHLPSPKASCQGIRAGSWECIHAPATHH
jgi:hypothetical protein